MIKKGNNIRFGNAIFIVEGIDDTHFLLKNKETKVINWVSKKAFFENIEKMNFNYILNESTNNKILSYNNGYVSVNLYEENNTTKINVITESGTYNKTINYPKKRALYEFNKHFNYYNELTEYRLLKYGFKKES